MPKNSIVLVIHCFFTLYFSPFDGYYEMFACAYHLLMIRIIARTLECVAATQQVCLLETECLPQDNC